MVSRIIYTEKDQGLPKFSLAYLQVFDRNWKELDNVELIVPDPENISTTNNKTKQNLMDINQYYTQQSPLSQYIIILNKQVEDFMELKIKIVLIKTRHGYEEPVLIYNSHHRKILENILIMIKKENKF